MKISKFITAYGTKLASEIDKRGIYYFNSRLMIYNLPFSRHFLRQHLFCTVISLLQKTKTSNSLWHVNFLHTPRSQNTHTQVSSCCPQRIAMCVDNNIYYVENENESMFDYEKLANAWLLHD